MLSLESMEMRLENPKAYYVFYEFFYKAAVGEVLWKECISDASKRIGNNTTEAFALLLLANNYKAWLYEEKMSHGEDLLTEYDTSPSGDGEAPIVDKLLVNQEFHLDSETEEFVVTPSTNKEMYDKAAMIRRDWFVKLRDQPICDEIKNSWQHQANVFEERSTNGSPPIHKKERERKRRKLMKGLKKWTGTAEEGERRFKGWSDSGHRAFELWTLAIKTDVRDGNYVIWEKAFRKVHIREQVARQDETTAVQKYTADTNLVWEEL